VTSGSKPITGTISAGISGPTLYLDATFAPGTASQFGLNVHTGGGQLTQIGYDTTTHEVYVDRAKSGDVSFDPTFASVQRAPFPLAGGTVRLHVLVDTSSVEVFTDQGQVVLTDQIFPSPSSTSELCFATTWHGHLVFWCRPVMARQRLAVTAGSGEHRDASSGSPLSASQGPRYETG
jgi:levanase